VDDPRRLVAVVRVRLPVTAALARRYGRSHRAPSQLKPGDVILSGWIAPKTRHTVTRIEPQKPGMLAIYARNESTGEERLYARVRANRSITFDVED
jgi:hypothetical protein